MENALWESPRGRASLLPELTYNCPMPASSISMSLTSVDFCRLDQTPKGTVQSDFPTSDQTSTIRWLIDSSAQIAIPPSPNIRMARFYTKLPSIAGSINWHRMGRARDPFLDRLVSTSIRNSFRRQPISAERGIPN